MEVVWRGSGSLGAAASSVFTSNFPSGGGAVGVGGWGWAGG